MRSMPFCETKVLKTHYASKLARPLSLETPRTNLGQNIFTKISRFCNAHIATTTGINNASADTKQQIEVVVSSSNYRKQLG